MNESATRRYYFSISRTFTRILLLTLLSFVSSIGLAPVAHAQVTTGDTYITYKKLFNNPDPIPATVHISNNSHTLAKNGWFLNTTDKKVLGPRLLFQFTFPPGTTGTNAEYTWDHISAPGGEYPDFVLRSCNIGTGPGGIDESSCIYSEVNYEEDASSLNSFWSTFWAGASASLGSPVGSIQQSVTTALNAATNSLVIFRKAPNGSYMSESTQDIFGAKWFNVNDRSTAIPVDWLQRPDQNVSLWYLADKINGNGSGSPAGPADTTEPDEAADDGTDTIKKWFNTYSYFKIDSVNFAKPASYEAALAESNTDPVNPNRDIEKSTLPE